MVVLYLSEVWGLPGGFVTKIVEIWRSVSKLWCILTAIKFLLIAVCIQRGGILLVLCESHGGPWRQIGGCSQH